jgi:hypothetical protein
LFYCGERTSNSKITATTAFTNPLTTIELCDERLEAAIGRDGYLRRMFEEHRDRQSVKWRRGSTATTARYIEAATVEIVRLKNTVVRVR